MDESRLLKLAKDLITTNSESPPGYEKDVAEVLREHMESYGFSCVSVGPKNRPNLIISNDGEIGDLVLHGHMDTVPVGSLNDWSHDPFAGEIVGGRLYGRGACDMKGPVAALAEAMICYKDSNKDSPLVMLATSDEESGCSGAEEVVKSNILADVKYGVCAEPTSLDVLVGEKGMFWSKIVATGKSAHGSRPEEGSNAIISCLEAIQVLTDEEYPYEPDELMGTATMNIGKIEGGIKINVVPDHCEALIDMRIVKGQSPEKISEIMNKRLVNAGLIDSVSVEYVHGKPAVVTPSDSPIVSASLDVVESVTGMRQDPKAATYGTDCSVLQPKGGIINVICGPGSIEQAHQPDEFICLDQLYKSVDVYTGIAGRILD